MINSPERAKMADGLYITFPNFYGNPGESVEQWLGWFSNYCTANNLDQIHSKAAMPFYFKEHALAWYQTLPAATRESYDTLLSEMKARFNGRDGLDVDMEILGLPQRHWES